MKTSATKGLIHAALAESLGLWSNLGYMQDTLSQNHRTGVQIGVELLAPEGITVKEFPSPLIDLAIEPNRLPEGSELLGHDVADAGFWSGLSNCAYTREEFSQLRPEWANRLNDFGLLQSERDAVAFKKITDKRVPEHAPFWVYRLSRLPQS